MTVDCNTKCVNITINDDSVLGMNKTFFVILMTTNDTKSTPEPKKGKVLIIDNDGEDALLVDVLYIYTIRVG